MTIDLATPWVAALNGNNLAPYARLEALAAAKDAPNGSTHPSWSWATNSPVLKSVPAGKEALWESVVALYRLQKLEEDDSDLWRDYVCAWLVCDETSLLNKRVD